MKQLTTTENLIAIFKKIQESNEKMASNAEGDRKERLTATADTWKLAASTVEGWAEYEKMLIMDAVKYGCSDWGSAKDAEQYYKSTFNTK